MVFSSANDRIEKDSETSQYIKRCIDSLVRLAENEDEDTYPMVLLPSNLRQFIFDLNDSESDAYTTIGGIVNGNSTVSDVMSFILKYGMSKTFTNDWEKFKSKVMMPHYYEPKLKLPYRPKARTVNYSEKKRYEPNGCFATAVIINLLLFITGLVFYIIGDGEGFGFAFYILIFITLPCSLYMFHDSDSMGSVVSYTTEKKRSKEEIDNDERKIKEDYEKAKKKAEERYEQRKKEAEERYAKELQEYPILLKQREAYWNELPSLIREKIKYAFWNYVYQQYNSTVEYKTVEQSKLPQRGAFEDKLFYELMKKGVEDIKTDIIATENGYFPDIAIANNKFFIDVEIDEPYEYKSKLLTHYIGSGDEERNAIFQDNGAFVIRFSEEQVKKHTSVCVDLVAEVRNFVDNCDIYDLVSILDLCDSIAQKRWTREEARFMMIERRREK